MGLPFVVLNMVSAVLFKDLGISDAQIAFWTSLIMWPWTIKFLWSPFLEIFRTKKFFVVTTQLLSGILFGLAALSLHLPSFFAVTIAVFAVVAFSGATHDIAADGVYMSELTTQDQAKYIGSRGRWCWRSFAACSSCWASTMSGRFPPGAALPNGIRCGMAFRA